MLTESPIQPIIDNLKSNDLGKELLESGLMETKEELINQKEEIEKDATKNSFDKKLGLFWISIKAKLLGIDIEEKDTDEEKKDETDKIKIETDKYENINPKEQFIIDQASRQGIKDPNQIAYILATAKGESGYNNIKEIGWEKKKYGKEWYYGRWYVQLTHKENYEKFNKIIKESGETFKDNNGNILKEIDIVKNPDIILQSDELSAFILIHGMKNGSFTNKKLADFINKNTVDFYNARSIINGMSSAPKKYAQFAQEYKKKIDTQVV